MAKRETPQPLRQKCPFCPQMMVRGTTVCPGCSRSWDMQDLPLIFDAIVQNPALRELSSESVLSSAVAEAREKMKAEAQVREAKRISDIKVQAQADADAERKRSEEKLARYEAMSPGKKYISRNLNKIIAAGIVMALLTAGVVNFATAQMEKNAIDSVINPKIEKLSMEIETQYIPNACRDLKDSIGPKLETWKAKAIEGNTQVNEVTTQFDEVMALTETSKAVMSFVSANVDSRRVDPDFDSRLNSNEKARQLLVVADAITKSYLKLETVNRIRFLQKFAPEDSDLNSAIDSVNEAISACEGLLE